MTVLSPAGIELDYEQCLSSVARDGFGEREKRGREGKEGKELFSSLSPIPPRSLFLLHNFTVIFRA